MSAHQKKTRNYMISKKIQIKRFKDKFQIKQKKKKISFKS